MELIKKIKQSETEAQEIIEQAKSEAARQAEEGRKNRLEKLEEAKQKRKEATEAVVATAESEGIAEVKGLKAQAEKKRQQLRDEADSKMASAVAKVMEYLRG